MAVRTRCLALLCCWQACSTPPDPVELSGPAVCTPLAPADDSSLSANAFLWTFDSAPPPPEQQQWVFKISELATTAEVHLARLSPAADSLLHPGNAVVLPVSPGRAAVAVGERVTRRGPSDVSWSGPIQGEKGGWVTLVLTDKGVTGTLQSVRTGEDGKLVFASYRFTPIGGGWQALVCVDPSKFPPDD